MDSGLIPVATNRTHQRIKVALKVGDYDESIGKLLTQDHIDFMKAMDLYKIRCRRPFPTWAEVHEVLVALGYRKVSPIKSSEEAVKRYIADLQRSRNSLGVETA